MPLILDNIVVFLPRRMVLLIGEFRSKGWATTVGTVIASYGPGAAVYPCAQLVYEYDADGESWAGTYTRGFWFRSSAKDFASRFLPSNTLVIRYNPSRPSDSFIRRADQIDGQLNPLF
jgi:hypothetical protein